MLALPYKLQYKILEFQEPKEIISLCESSINVMKALKEMMNHTNFIIECKVIIPDEQVEWFETNNIKLKLLEEYYINKFGDQFWYKNCKRHRDNDLPAVIHSNGDCCWYKNNKLHRDNDLPAAILLGAQYWFKNGILHRDKDNPAIIRENGDQEWYKNGLLHRETDNPSIIRKNGDQFWYKNSKRHRDKCLPAIIYSNGDQEWYKNGVKIDMVSRYR